jgi:hypothetical protein
MPLNLPPGTGQSVVPAVTPTWIFTPNTSATNTIRVTNIGQYPVYVGGLGCGQANGFPLPPGSRPLELQNVTATLYAASYVSVGSSVSTLNAGYTAGASTVVTATSVTTSAGSVLVVGSTVNTGWESVVVGTVSSSGTTIGTSAPLLMDHASGQVVYSATAQIGQIRVSAGVV